jgi:hypothetical protein
VRPEQLAIELGQLSAGDKRSGSAG